MHANTEVTTFDHLKAIIQLPFVVLIIVPIILIFLFENDQLIDLRIPSRSITFPLGVFVFVVGFTVFIKSIDLFIKIGKGTLAPWNPTKK